MLALTLVLWTLSAIVLVFYFGVSTVPDAWLANGLLLMLAGCCVLPWWVAQRSSRDQAEVIVFFGLWSGLTFAFKAFVVLWQPFSLALGIPFLYRKSLYDAVSWALFIALLGIAGVLIGYYMPLGERIAARLPVLTAKWQNRNAGPAVLLLIVGLFAIVRKSIGLPLPFPQPLARSMDFVLGVCPVFVAISLFLLWGLAFQHQQRYHWVLVYFCLILTVGAFYITLWRAGKAGLVEICLAIGLAWHYSRSPIRAKNLLPFLVTLVFLIFPLVSMYRGSDISNPVERANAALSGLFSLSWDDYWRISFVSFLDRLDSFNVLSAITESYPRILPFLNGQGILQELTAGFLPAFLSPSKPIADWAVQMNVFLGGGGSSASAVTQIGDLYRNFGAWGVFPGMVLIGITLRSLYEWCMRMVRSGNHLGYVLYLGALMVLISGEGTMAAFFLVLPRTLLVLLAACVFLSLSRQSSAQRRV